MANLTDNNALNQYQLDDAGRDRMNVLGGQFASMFENFVGRKPTDTETSTFIGQYVNPNRGELLNSGSARSQDPYTYLTQFVNNTYQPAAKDQAMEQLTQQQGEANRLSDLFRTQGRQAINDTETQLADYQSKLFERLRPNLITSLQAQGLLNSGGLNTALAGAAGDLGTAAQGSLIDQRLQNEQQANAIKFGGQSAPYEYQRGNTLNGLDYMRGQGASAMDNAYKTFLTNMNFQNQMALQRQSMGGGKGGFFQQLGNSMAPALGAQLGQNLANFAIPNYTSTSSNTATGIGSSRTGISAFLK